MATIETRSLTKRFGRLTAVDGVDLKVEAGEVLCLLGPSGCGKTTTLRMIAGLEAVTAGEVRLGGAQVTRLAPRARNVAMVFQFYALYPTLTVAENIAYPLHAERLSQADIGARVRRTLEILHLEEVAERVASRLSEGEKQRVAVGRAIVRDPSCFLFDEPLSRLDVQLRETMRGQIKEVLVGLSKATMIVTHDQLEALTMADRIAVMQDGVIEQCDTPHRVFAEPANLFVAGFIGTPQMNLLPATAMPAEDGAVGFRIGDQAFRPLPGRGTAMVEPGEGYTLGMRPRSLDIRSEAVPGSLAAVVDLIEPMGAETLVHLTAGEADIRVVTPRGQRARVGERVHVVCNPDKLHVFGSDGRRLAQ